MRIALVTHNVVRGDGQGRINYEVAREALARGHQVTMLATRVAPEVASHPAARWLAVPVDGWPTQLVRNQVFAWRATRGLAAHRRSFDVIAANGFVCWHPAHVNTVHLVHHAWLRSPCHTFRLRKDPVGWYQGLNTLLNVRFERGAFRQSQVIVAVSGKVRHELVAAGVTAGMIRVIPNGVDPDEFYPGTADRRRWGLPDGVPLALFAGDIKSPRKNLETVLHALPACPGLHLAVVGEQQGSPYPARAARLGLGPRVHFVGFRQDMPQLMRAADFFVFPSRYDPFALVVLEAMASGLPVITARTVGAAELVDPSCGIVLDDADDVGRLTQALRRLAHDAEGRRRMGAAARRIAERHTFAAMAQRHVDLLEEVHP